MSLTTEGPRGLEITTSSAASAHRAALRGGKNFLYVCPPAPWAVLSLFAAAEEPTSTGVHTLAIAPERATAVEVATLHTAASPERPAHPVTGLARACRVIAAGRAAMAVLSPGDLLELLHRSAFRETTIRRVAVLWPESLAPASLDAVETALAEYVSAQRLIVTSDESACAEFLERHARRAPRWVASSPPEEPGPSVQYAVAGPDRLARAVREVLDVLDPPSALLWDPTPTADRWPALVPLDASVTVASDPGTRRVDLAIAVHLPTSESLDALRKAARRVVVLARAAALPYLGRLAQEPQVLRLPSEADAHLDAALATRRRLRQALAEGAGRDALGTLAPLFDEYDPALVAAAALTTARAPAPADLPSWVRIRLSVGRQDGVRASDLVGAMINAAGVARDAIGRIEVGERYAVAEVRTEYAEQGLRGMTGVVVRGRRVTAAVDRGRASPTTKPGASGARRSTRP